ncbi:hypothetical protein EJB05_48653, partial [Eragrostis curvula]
MQKARESKKVFSRLSSVYGQSRTTTLLRHGASNIFKTSSSICLVNPCNTFQSDVVAFGETTTDMALDEFHTDVDTDRPTTGFSSIPEAIEDIRQGKYIIVVDDEDRENEGDLIMATSKVTPEATSVIRRASRAACLIFYSMVSLRELFRLGTKDVRAFVKFIHGIS